MELEPICINCKNYIGNQKCKAFDLIPTYIWSLGFGHTKPLPEQENDIVFEPMEKDGL